MGASYRVVPFRPGHVDRFTLQPVQALSFGRVSDAALAAVATSQDAFTLLVDGRPVACAGLHAVWPGRALAWALLSECGPECFLAVDRRVRGFLARHGDAYRRIEATVRSDFAAGHRWIRLLGFRREGTMRFWGPEGADYDMYARVAGAPALDGREPGSPAVRALEGREKR